MIDWVIGAGFLLACVGVYFVMRWGWKRRGRRQADVARPTPAPAEGDLGTAALSRDLFYVATTRSGDQLDRIVTHGLGFRGRAVATVHPEGLVLDIAGVRPFLIPIADITSVATATWTIDRVVENGGLVRIGWRLGEAPVDTYLRDNEGSTPLVDALTALVPATGPAGSADAAGTAPTRGDTTP
ncbi:hypothetical protein AX769_12985 [Frondihabitans sp. PAMC 28766]|uniref:PH-like domain-containing protein n=1 Tax=Frondihabitans sp. PAMC 28766 TaxID=1795630 RepID=UPI00078E83E0|nr:hypothetical protein [Frondihabitans sp. PAMC 28766]AMM20886.1 hypothetical protein AX769_12985 [Frondihabitans sp. PAMC 28766]